MKKIFLIVPTLLLINGCASVITIEQTTDCLIESPTLTAWAYNLKGEYHLIKVCKDGNGNKCSQELLEHAKDPIFNVKKIESLIAEREKQKLMCGNSLSGEKRYTINDNFYNKILSSMKAKVKEKKGSSFWNDLFS
jgi:hypothetical protein